MFMLILISFSSLKAEDGIVRTDPLLITTQIPSKQTENQNYTVYRVYAFGIAAGDVYFSSKDGKIEAKGQTYKSLRFIYSYDFFYIEQDDYIALYEKEKDREKIYQNKEVYEKKPWLPIISMFFKDGLSDEKILSLKLEINNAPVFIKKTEDDYQKIFYFIPQESKTKKITVYIKKGENLPYRIDIEGKTDISLERVIQR